MLNEVISTLIIGIFGYLVGSINAAIIFSKILYKDDIRQKGSGNAGATNMTRVHHFKIGVSTMLIDTAKVILVVIVAWLLKNNTHYFKDSFVQVAGFLAFIGHIFPIYFKFKGGKGVSSWWGFLLSFNWLLGLIILICGLTISKVWKKVSIASMTMPFFAAGLAFIPWFNSGIFSILLNQPEWWISPVFLLIIAAIIFIAHIPNLKRLLKGKELGVKK